MSISPKREKQWGLECTGGHKYVTMMSWTLCIDIAHDNGDGSIAQAGAVLAGPGTGEGYDPSPVSIPARSHKVWFPAGSPLDAGPACTVQVSGSPAKSPTSQSECYSMLSARRDMETHRGTLPLFCSPARAANIASVGEPFQARSVFAYDPGQPSGQCPRSFSPRYSAGVPSDGASALSERSLAVSAVRPPHPGPLSVFQAMTHWRRVVNGPLGGRVLFAAVLTTPCVQTSQLRYLFVALSLPRLLRLVQDFAWKRWPA